MQCGLPLPGSATLEGSRMEPNLPTQPAITHEEQRRTTLYLHDEYQSLPGHTIIEFSALVVAEELNL